MVHLRQEIKNAKKLDNYACKRFVIKLILNAAVITRRIFMANRAIKAPERGGGVPHFSWWGGKHFGNGFKLGSKLKSKFLACQWPTNHEFSGKHFILTAQKFPRPTTVAITRPWMWLWLRLLEKGNFKTKTAEPFECQRSRINTITASFPPNILAYDSELLYRGRQIYKCN